MRTAKLILFLLLSALILLPGVAYSEEYTRIGAIAAGNETGDIPAYEGAKNLKCPEVYKKGDYLPSPFKDDKLLFKIDHTNVDKYKNRLSPGQIARLKRNKNFYMNVYPSHRTHQFPDKFYEATEKNVETCKLGDDKKLHGFNGGVPFPYPRCVRT